MLHAAGISKSYPTRAGDLVVLRDASLTLAEGESAAIVGPSGSGKSTLLNILGTLEPPTAGELLLDGVDPRTLSPRALAAFRNRRIGFVFQDHHLLPQCTVLENVLVPTLVARGCGAQASEPRRGGQSPSFVLPGEPQPRARALLERLGLTERHDHFPAELSGGEKQRVALARALINAPAIVLADEPTGNLDRGSAERIGELLAELPCAFGVTLVVVTHSDALARRFDRTFELDGGCLRPRAD
jgi:lipoprotein-releasing system ATP-binding protein